MGCALPISAVHKPVVDALLRGAELLLLEALTHSLAGNICLVQRCNHKIDELLHIQYFPAELKGDVEKISRKILWDTYEKVLNDLVFEALETAKTGDQNAKKLARDRLTQACKEARSAGVPASFLKEVSLRDEIISLTTDGSLDEPAKRAAEQKTRIKDTPPLVANERRRTLRYAAPEVIMTLSGGEECPCINWSCMGFLVASESSPKVDKTVRFSLHCPVIPQFRERFSGVVVRQTPGRNFAVALPEMDTRILRLMKLLKSEGIRPDLY